MPLSEPNYNYQPVYGVDPWEQNGPLYSDLAGTTKSANGTFGGGAEVTAQNLLISLWWIEGTKDLDGLTVPDEGSLLIPKVEFGNVDLPAPPGDKVNVVAGREQEFLSRDAARFLLNLWDLPTAPTTWTLLAVLNPPPGYRERLAGATDYTGGIKGETKKPLLDSLLWNVTAQQGAGMVTGIGLAVDQPSFAVGQADIYVAGGTNQRMNLPLLKTNGADGVYPEFFGGTTASILAEQAARNNGDFYVPVVIESIPDSGDDVVFTISYPHSAARGH
jgi:hypothetical protein